MNLEPIETTESKDTILAWNLNQASPRPNSKSKTHQMPVYLWARSPQEQANLLFRRAQSLDLQFEGLLVDILARFANLPVDQVDCEIEDALKRVCVALGLQWAQ